MADIYTTPAMQAPKGQTSNLVDPYSRKASRISLAAAALAVVLIFVSIRLIVRRKVKKFNSEDWVLLAAIASFTALEAMLITICLYGDGKHMWDVSVAELYITLYYENISEMLYCTTMFPIKYVLLQQIKSIFFAHDRRSPFHMTINVLVVANLLLYLSLMLTFLFACTPREKIYHPLVNGHCINTTICQAAASALNIASDITILIVPMFGIAKLQMALKKKFMAASVFAIGIFAVIASVVRMYYSLTLFWDEDKTFPNVGNWTIIEFMTGFIVAGAPYVPRFVEMVFKRQKQVAPAYPSYDVSKRSASNVRPHDASWIALREQDYTPLNCSANHGQSKFIEQDPSQRFV